MAPVNAPQMRMDLRQSQTLAMTPQLQQAIKLLQLNNLELTELLIQEAEQNPLLDIDGPDTGLDNDNDIRPENDRSENQSLIDSDKNLSDRDSALDIEVDNNFNSDTGSDAMMDGPSLGSWDTVGSGGSFTDGEYDALSNVSDTPHLRDHLLEQIQLDLTDPAERLIAMVLLDQLDEAGYFAGNITEIAQMLGTDEASVEAVLVKLQHSDPPGIFARDLKECLMLQLEDKTAADPALQILLDNLDLLAAHNNAKLEKLCKVDAEKLTKFIADIRLCNPKPATSFDFSPVNSVTPDILVRPAREGGFSVELNPDTLPKALVNQTYFEKIVGNARSRQEKDYINDRFHAASFLVKALHQRATTIMKVSTEILRRQELFFYQGVGGMKPMTLKDVAEAIDMHESTVSRVTSNKFMATPRGLFELKYFFSTGLASAHGGDAHSSESVRQRIKQLIEREDVAKPLSDDQLVIVLQSEGIEVARRTIAKYRESLKIASSFQRRRKP